MRIDRMLGIIVFLLNRDRVSARLLAERFEVSLRTIYRDLDSISCAGIPIITYPGKNGGYGIMANYKLDRQVLSLEDMSSIISALKSVNVSIGGDDLDTVAEKILNLVPTDKVETIKKKFEEFSIDFTPWGFKPVFREYIRTIQQAISDAYLISFTYRSSKGESLFRKVEPMTLVFKGYAWYLYGFCLTRNDYRLFRITRMTSPAVLSEHFNRREKTYQEFVTAAGDVSSYVTLKLKFSPVIKQKAEEYFPEGITEVLADGSSIVTLALPEDEWIYSMIFSFGEYAEVLQPVRIRDLVKEKTRKMLEVYDNDLKMIT